MTVAEFLAWDAPVDTRWQLVDGDPVAMAPTSRTHGSLQGEMGRLIGNYLAASRNFYTVITAPGVVPRVRGNENFRIPDLAVTCTRYDTEEYDVADPVLIVEILSPSNRAETWRNVWAFTTIPSVREILLLSSTSVRAELLRRGDDGSWPAASSVIETGDLVLDSIGLALPLVDIYRTTRLARAQAHRRTRLGPSLSSHRQHGSSRRTATPPTQRSAGAKDRKSTVPVSTRRPASAIVSVSRHQRCPPSSTAPVNTAVRFISSTIARSMMSPNQGSGSRSSIKRWKTMPIRIGPSATS